MDNYPWAEELVISRLMEDAVMLFGFGFAAWRIMMRYLHFYQQEEYDSVRFLRWWLRGLAFEKRATAFSFGVGAALLFPVIESALPAQTVVLIAALLALLGWSNHDSNAKKPLALTARARRILLGGMVAQVLIFFALSRGLIALEFQQTSALLIASGILLLLTPFSLTLSNSTLAPFEAMVQQGYLRQARRILQENRPVVIGITGSYGKTSTKQILAHILDSHAPTLSTRGSVNTVMGITREIRERLKTDHQFFVVEMGAYGVGSIRRLCNLTPPQAAIVTAVGWAHYERYKSIETVAIAKSELPQAIPESGFAVLNGDDPRCRAMAEKTKGQAFFYGSDAQAGPLHCRLLDHTLTPDGVQCRFEYEGQAYSVVMPVFGEHMATNAAAAFLTACKFGVAPITAVAALKTLPQVKHRLEVHRGSDGVTTIDDAYNSNPAGFANALEVLRTVPGERKILVTPGMVELGERETEEYRRLAPTVVEVCDIVCLVAEHRIPSFVDALLSAGLPEERLRRFGALAEARAFLRSELRGGDVTLFENDLPDLYENKQPFRLFPRWGNSQRKSE